MSDEENVNTQHLVTCVIAVGGDPGTTVVRGPTRPIPWPEILVLQHLHGEQYVTDIKPCGLMPRGSALQEKRRMGLIYGSEVLDEVYAGKAPAIEWYMPGHPIEIKPKTPARKEERV